MSVVHSSLLSFCPSVKRNDKKEKNQDMKKTYVSPLSVEVSVASEQLLATSELHLNSDKEVDTSKDGNQLGGKRRGEWGNLW